MASILSFWKTYEPLPRYLHLSGRVGSKVVLQGGLTEDFPETSRQHLSSVVEIFDLYTESWEKRPVTGDAPSPGAYIAASASLHDDLFSFGGFDGSQFFNTLRRLDAEKCWSQVSPQNADGAPMPKAECGMIALGNGLGVFGGYGVPRGATEPQSFIRNTRFTDGRGWTNEFHIYNLSQGAWSCPSTTGERPAPCHGFTLTAVDERRAVMFGGYNSEQSDMNDVYNVDLSSMNWSRLKRSGCGPWPEERSQHAACCLNYGQQFPLLLMTGGLDRQNKPLGDAWILDIERGNWRKESVTPKACWGHSLTAVSLGPGMTEVVEFGGTHDPWTGFYETQPKMADTTLLQFRLVESSGESQWELLSEVDNTLLGSQQRMIEKLHHTAESWHQSKGEREMMGVERRQLEGERDRAREEKREMEGERERERVEAQARANVLQRRLEEVERREHEKSVVQEQAIAAEQRGPSWEVMEEELEETDETLGTGGWAVVKVAKLKVAAKCLHSQLVYDYHRRLFRREMDVAAQVSHPNLLRFLGARLEGGMAILTEFMPTSLRALVNRRPRQHLPLQHLLCIAVDVARALNYLHNITPDPIIHRDLSSANVLLQPSPDGGWLAKVSDYGTANFQSQLQTENPGSPVYTAPESNNPALQSPKMDIFSFGVLLVEMCTCDFPAPERRAELMESIRHEGLLNLIRRCLREDRDRRPTAAQLVDILQAMQ